MNGPDPSSLDPQAAAGETHRILHSAREQFIQMGFSKVTTDEIAGALGMSKKTLYKHFPTKEALLAAVMRFTMGEISEGAAAIIYDGELGYTDKLSRLMAFFSGHISRLFSRPFIQDVRRKRPHLWAEVEAFRREQIFTKFANLVAEGVNKGYLRGDVHQDLITRIYLAAAQHILNPETLAELPLTAREAFDGIVRTLFEGLLTEKGRKTLQESLYGHGQ